MATKRRKVSRKEKARRAKISKSLKSYHRRQRREREPTRKITRVEERRPEQSLGDYILQSIRGLREEQKPTKFELPEGREAGGFDMKDQHPDLPRRYSRNTQASMMVNYVYFTDDGDLQQNSVRLFFDTGANDEEFWHNYHAAIRDELEIEIADVEGGYQDFSVFVASMA